MIIDTKSYEKSHGKKPGGFREAWHFHARAGSHTESFKFENLEFGTAKRRFLELVKNSTRFQTKDAVAVVNP